MNSYKNLSRFSIALTLLAVTACINPNGTVTETTMITAENKTNPGNPPAAVQLNLQSSRSLYSQFDYLVHSSSSSRDAKRAQFLVDRIKAVKDGSCQQQVASATDQALALSQLAGACKETFRSCSVAKPAQNGRRTSPNNTTMNFEYCSTHIAGSDAYGSYCLSGSSHHIYLGRIIWAQLENICEAAIRTKADDITVALSPKKAIFCGALPSESAISSITTQGPGCTNTEESVVSKVLKLRALND